MNSGAYKSIFSKVSVLAILLLVLLSIFIVSCQQPSKSQTNLEYLKSIKKIDIHTHVRSNQPFLKAILDSTNLKMCTICTIGANARTLRSQIDTAKMLYKTMPRYYAWVTTFDVSNRNEPGWTENVIKQLKDDFDDGAVGVKFWKAIGMTFKKENGEYLQLDDPIFTPIFDFIAKEGKTVLAHMGEPIHAWMPTYTLPNGTPRNYWAKHPEFSFWDKPELPSYSDIMAARDHVLDKHPDLRFVGAHLASLEFDVDEIALRMEKYPNFAVDIGGRTRYLMWQARGKVKDFIQRYQDRIMYSTDRGTTENPTKEDIAEQTFDLLHRNNVHYTYFATEDEIPWGNVIYSDKPEPEATYNVKGLGLSKEILEKLFYKNAVKWFPGVEKDF